MRDKILSAGVRASDEEEEEPQRKKRAPKKEKKAPKARKPVQLGNIVNRVKTSNKLIGEIENNDLYDSDDLLDLGARADNSRLAGEDFRGKDIDFGTTPTETVRVTTDENEN